LPDDLKADLYAAYNTMIRVHQWVIKRIASEAANERGEPFLADEVSNSVPGQLQDSD